VRNLYSITTNQSAIIALFRAINYNVGNLPPMPGVFPDYPAPVIRNAGADRELTTMHWGTVPMLQAVIAPTKPAALRRIDSPEANARPMNFQRVAIDDAGLPYTPAKPIHDLQRYMRYRVGKNRKWAVATQTGSRTVSDSANRKQVGQLNRCRLVTGTNLTSSERYNCISMPQVGQVGASRSSSECFSLSITNPPQVG
jgi:hypothetical protein